jgi:hypothetical protein
MLVAWPHCKSHFLKLGDFFTMPPSWTAKHFITNQTPDLFYSFITNQTPDLFCYFLTITHFALRPNILLQSNG